MNNTIKGFKPQVNIGSGDLVPFWKDSTNETSKITYELFISSILATIIVQSAGSATNKVMSQKAVTDELLAMDLDISAIEEAVLNLSNDVTDTATIALLEDEANWTDLKHYNGTAITTQKAGDTYMNDDYIYRFYTKSSTLKIGRIPYGSL